MIKIHYGNSAYHIKLLNLINNKVTVFKFDTGAINTIISFEALVDGKMLKQIDKQNFMNSLRKNIPTKDFRSASGNYMKGFLCKATDVKIGDAILSKFYYYLVFNINHKIALLGDDFISCCNFIHESNSDIIINDFDDDNYTINQNTYALSEDEITLALLEADNEVAKANYIKTKLEKERLLWVEGIVSKMKGHHPISECPFFIPKIHVEIKLKIV